jgi:AcrR family transcriptional regulator
MAGPPRGDPPKPSRRRGGESPVRPLHGPARRDPPAAAGVRPTEGAVGLPSLPPGRHGLPRAFVVQNQRDRITAGMIAAVVERGYTETAVARVIAAGRISRRTFYDNYADKSEAYFDVYSQVTDFLVEAMAEARESERRGWAARVRAQLAALLACFDANRDLALFCFARPPEAGGEVAATYRRFLEQLGELLAEGRPRRARRPTPAARYGLLGGLAALIVEAARSGDADSFVVLLPELVELVLTPYLGREVAASAARPAP